MNEKSVPPEAFYARTAVVGEGGASGDDATAETFDSSPATAGPWSAEAQHAGPPSALLVRALERLPEAAGTVVGRVAVDLWGPVPVGPVTTRARVVRRGRSVRLVRSELLDPARDRVVATAQAWLLPASDDGPGRPGPALPHRPADGHARERPESWGGGYLDAIDWRWITGALEEPGRGTVWMRSPDLVAGETISPLQRLLACVDSASGVGAALDVREWAFLNTELTVHVLRPPVGEWVCLDAVTTLGPGSVGVATSEVHDERGLVARSAQTLLVVRR